MIQFQNMKKYAFILFICLIIPALSIGQSLFQARKQMDKYNYAVAIKILKDAVNNVKTANEAIPMLAECYRMQHDIPNSKSTYAKAITLPNAKPETFFYYAKALQTSGEYEKAREVFQEYLNMNPSDVRGRIWIAHCDSVIGPWKSIQPIFEAKLASIINTEQSDFGSSFYQNNLIYASDYASPLEKNTYGWTGRGYLNIMKASLVSKNDFWGDLQNPSEFDTKFEQKNHDGPAAFSADGNTIYFTRSFYGKTKTKNGFQTNRLKIYFAAKTDGVWSDVKPFYLNSDEYSVGHPSLSANGQTLYFVSDMPGGQGGTDIWMCRRNGDTWGMPMNLGSKVNTSENEMFPTISENDLLYFASEGHPGYGGLDVFKTQKVDGVWTTPVNLHSPINSAYDDFAFTFAPEGKSGFFSSNRPAGIGSDDIYAFRFIEKPKPIIPVVVPPTCLSGIVKDKTTMKPISGATVFLFEPNSGQVKVVKTDANGLYKVCNIKPAEYIIKAMLPNTIADCIKFPISNPEPGTTLTAPRDLLLDKLLINKTFKIDNIYYDFDKFNIREDAKSELDKLVRIMQENAIDVELGSHTDCRGSDTYNDKLSQNRAQSAVDYIVSTGIAKRRITAKGYGERQLKNKCSNGVDCSPEEHQENRRTEFKVTNLSPVETVLEFDLSKFRGDEEVPAYVFGSTFFDACYDKKNEKKEYPANEPNLKAGTSESVNPSQSKSSPSEKAKSSIKEPATLNPDLYPFRVQFLAISIEKPTNDPTFENITDVKVYHEKGIYKYTSGLFKSQKEASNHLEKMKKLGFTDAFVVNYKSGKLIKATK